jgi:hypothetical protein
MESARRGNDSPAIIICAMKVIPIVGVVVSAVLIVIGRTQRMTALAIAGYVLLALSALLYLYLRSR